MSKQHPVVAVTGSSGAGTTTVKTAFEHIFRRLEVTAAIVEGDSFHRFNRKEMAEAIGAAASRGENISHFGPEANLLCNLGKLFKTYGETGNGKRRYYVHNEIEAREHGVPAGEFTDWQDLPRDTDMLLYEGLHGAMVTDECDVARFADLLIGVVPIVNLEWIQKIHRDTQQRGYAETDVTRTILRRMEDYVNHITPQFSRTDINFQRVPTVDTSNPFIARDVPTPDESFVVIRFRDPAKFEVDFPYLLAMIDKSFVSRRNTIVVPGGKMLLAMELILMPILKRMVNASRTDTRLVA
ncbi:MAG: phosphoribulokinase [Gammaproteobacteria bacterium]|nr:phosphoribulokinase [Gammaproteobacteria bacterium]MDH5619386.1 phosphoribulokinase [Gammaproteobacteria bacterium]